MADENETEFDPEKLKEDKENQVQSFMSAIESVSKESGESPQKIISDIQAMSNEKKENESEAFEMMQDELDIGSSQGEKSTFEHLKEIQAMQNLGGGGGFGGSGTDITEMMTMMAQMMKIMQPQQQQPDMTEMMKVMASIQSSGSQNDQTTEILKEMVKQEREQRQSLEEQIQKYRTQGSTGDEVQDKLLKRIERLEKKLESNRSRSTDTGIEQLVDEAKSIEEKKKKLQEVGQVLTDNQQEGDGDGDTDWAQVLEQFAGQIGNVAKNMPKQQNKPGQKSVNKINQGGKSSESKQKDDSSNIVDAQEVLDKVETQEDDGQDGTTKEPEASDSAAISTRDRSTTSREVEISGSSTSSEESSSRGEQSSSSTGTTSVQAAIQTKVDNNTINDLRTEAGELGVSAGGSKEDIAERIVHAQNQ